MKAFACVLAVLLLSGCCGENQACQDRAQRWQDYWGSYARSTSAGAQGGRACYSHDSCGSGQVCANTNRNNLTVGECVAGVR